ncbi:hypothetical protein BDV09DRAFT_190619 [Aspergillus tetrazonus]
MTYKNSFGHLITFRKAGPIVVYAYVRRVLAAVELWLELHTSPQTTRPPCSSPARAVTAAPPAVSSSARAVSSSPLLTSTAKRQKPLPDYLLSSDLRSIRATVDRDRAAAHSITT